VVEGPEGITAAWEGALAGGPAAAGARVIVEKFLAFFSSEITRLT